MNKFFFLLMMHCCACIMVAQTSLPVYLDETESIEESIGDILSRMTLEEKVDMIHAQSKFSTKGCPRLGIPELWMSDGPHGVRMEIAWDSWKHAGWTNDSCTAFPALTCLAATFNPELAWKYGKAVGEEARFRKKDVLLGPGVNIYRVPLNGRNFEYMGEDPYLASRMVVPYIQGVQSNGVAACLKHFALNNQESNRKQVNVEVSDRALREIYLPAFKAGVEEGKVWMVMGAYNKFRGKFCSHHEFLLQKILKGEWQFDGVVVTDWGSAHDTREAALYGLDMEMGTGTDGLTKNTPLAYQDYYLAKPYLKMLRSGELPLSSLDDKVKRVLRLCLRTNMDRRRPYGSLATQEHADIARQIAEEGIVLLKNDNHFFPIKRGKYKKIAVIGQNAVRSLTVGGGSSELKAKKEIFPLEGLMSIYGKKNIYFSMGYTSGPSKFHPQLPAVDKADSLRYAAIALAKDADIVLFFGGLNKNYKQDCEGVDRTSYGLPYGQDQLIREILKVNKNVAVVLISGNAVSMPWIDDIPAVVQSWYLGSESGNAMGKVIAGDVNPSGKLPFSIPVRLEDNGACSFGASSYPGDGTNVYYKEDILVGYRWHDTQKIPALFPFGHGLSYTEFAYGELKTDKKIYDKDENIVLSLKLTNRGKCGGAESVQIYAGQSHPSVLRPIKELKAFKKVFLLPGESKNVTFSIPAKELAFYDEISKMWIVESDCFTFFCGASSTDIHDTVSVNIR